MRKAQAAAGKQRPPGQGLTSLGPEPCPALPWRHRKHPVRAVAEGSREFQVSLGSQQSSEMGGWSNGEGTVFVTFQTSQRPSQRCGWWTGDAPEPRLGGKNCILLSTRMKINYMDSNHPWKRSASYSPNHFPLSPGMQSATSSQPSLRLVVVM